MTSLKNVGRIVVVGGHCKTTSGRVPDKKQTWIGFLRSKTYRHTTRKRVAGGGGISSQFPPRRHPTMGKIIGKHPQGRWRALRTT